MDRTGEALYELYLANTRYVNNWDLVDASAREIVGGYLADRSREPLDRLAASSSLWERRISIVATHYFIRSGEFADTLRIAERLLDDREDLIHKAVGWMLREVGKKHQPTLESFLKRHGRVMPRTALRYAIERFPADLRRAYLDGSACDAPSGATDAAGHFAFSAAFSRMNVRRVQPLPFSALNSVGRGLPGAAMQIVRRSPSSL